MRIFITIFLFFFFQQFIVAVSPCTKCDIEKVKIANEHLDSLTIQIIRDFLSTFDSSCDINVEYSGWSNETLFAVMQKAPTLFFQIIQEGNVNSKQLINEIESPVNDLIDLQKTYDELKASIAETEIKSIYLEAIIFAGKKSNLKIFR